MRCYNIILSQQSLKNVTLGIGFTFDQTGRNWDILKTYLGWTDNDIQTIINGVYQGNHYSNSNYTITQQQAYDIFNAASLEHMTDLNNAIQAFNNQNGYITSYSQRELEAMFDYTYNNGLSPTADTGYQYSSDINDPDQIIFHYLRKNLPVGVNAVKQFGNGTRRRLNQMNLFFYDYTFVDKTGTGLDPLRAKLGF